jgi:NitT/TauT family transport system substrate-binding protein
MAPLHIAQQEGYFEDEGLNVEFIRLGRNVDAVPALIQGQVEVGVGQLTVNILNAMSAGARIRAVAGSGHLSPSGCTYHATVIRSALLGDDKVVDPGQLRGRKAELDIAIPHAYWFAETLRPVGLTLEDLEVVNVPPAATADAFLGDSFDLTMLSEPYLSELVQFEEAAVWRGAEEVVPDYQQTMVFFGPSLLDDRLEEGVRFVAAVIRGMRQYNLGKTPRNLDILERATGLTRRQLAVSCWPSISVDGQIHAAGFSGYQRWALEQGLVARVLSEEQLIDLRYLDRANAELAR